ncbi:PilW family protein [Diaphorobacter caeni]|uniref:PilW family protein n=1 Tax=Diaphorobacter caeni TaxID=2784387 RepID=UPI00188FE2E1|nr:hypothetical protein [Diaphorobacter caeni]MBF5005272.1 hypothetical protein [Diaphorobacter caeni]
MSLVELLIGLSIGLVIIGIALTSLQVSQFVSTTVSESTTLLQDANTALRIIGAQIRQTESVALNLQPSLGSDIDTAALRPVMFEQVLNVDEAAAVVDKTISAVSSPNISKSVGAALQIQYENFVEYLLSDATAPTWDSALRDCLGQNKSNRSLSTIITSTFFLRDGNLMCTGVAGTAQPLIANVKDFTIRLLREIPAEISGNEPQFQYATPASLNAHAAQWQNVSAVEICLELEAPAIKAPDVGAEYQPCSGQQRFKGSKLIVLARQLFHIRAHGK